MLGTGSFGRVCLAVHKEKGFVCAIKALSKAHIIKNQQARSPAGRAAVTFAPLSCLVQTLPQRRDDKDCADCAC